MSKWEGSNVPQRRYFTCKASSSCSGLNLACARQVTTRSRIKRYAAKYPESHLVDIVSSALPKDEGELPVGEKVLHSLQKSVAAILTCANR